MASPPAPRQAFGWSPACRDSFRAREARHAYCSIIMLMLITAAGFTADGHSIICTAITLYIAAEYAFDTHSLYIFNAYDWRLSRLSVLDATADWRQSQHAVSRQR